MNINIIQNNPNSIKFSYIHKDYATDVNCEVNRVNKKVIFIKVAITQHVWT